MTETTLPSVPAHVPPELVRHWDAVSGVGVHFHATPFEAIDDIHRDAPPIFFSSVPGYKREGAWYVTRQQDIRTVLGDPATFSSADIVGFSGLVGETFPMLPVEVDPPQHTQYRQLLSRFFDPRSVQQFADKVRATAVSRIDGFVAAGRCEFGAQFGQPFPISIALDLLGLPTERLFEFKGWVDQLLHGTTLQEKAAGAGAIHGYLRQVIDERKRQPGTDIVSSLCTAEIDGRRLDDRELLGLVWLLLSGGLDTVVSALGFHFRHLATHPELQRELRADPQRIPATVEEFLRAFSMVSLPRRVARHTELSGVQMRAGDWVMVTTAFGGRDPAVVPDPQAVDIHRSGARHVAFGNGPHMCLGMHLARLELRVAIEEWLARVPEFSLDTSQPFRAHAGGVFGVDEMHLRWPV